LSTPQSATPNTSQPGPATRAQAATTS
jgi:hypothetical protein